MYAVVEIGGKQYSVKVGDEIFVEKLDAAEGSEYRLDRVVAVEKDGSFTVGRPFLEGVNVLANVVKTGKKKKIRVFIYKPKKNYKKTFGHRQMYTKLKIEAINF